MDTRPSGLQWAETQDVHQTSTFFSFFLLFRCWALFLERELEAFYYNMAKVEIEKDIHLQIWNSCVIWYGKTSFLFLHFQMDMFCLFKFCNDTWNHLTSIGHARIKYIFLIWIPICYSYHCQLNIYFICNFICTWSIPILNSM